MDAAFSELPDMHYTCAEFWRTVLKRRITALLKESTVYTEYFALTVWAAASASAHVAEQVICNADYI